MKHLTAAEIYKKLKTDIKNDSTGEVKFSLAGVDVTIDTTDIVGNILQSWFGQWLKQNNIYFRTKSNTQEFPDFLLDKYQEKGHLLEVKSFNAAKGPGFDLANFDSYWASLESKSYRLNADYLIFSYTMIGSKISISNVWLKKIWELTSTSSNHVLKVQDKRGIIYNIRPCTFYSTSSRATQPFSCKEDFIIALYQTLKNYDKSSINADTWLENVKENYLLHYNSPLEILDPKKKLR